MRMASQRNAISVAAGWRRWRLIPALSGVGYRRSALRSAAKAVRKLRRSSRKLHQPAWRRLAGSESWYRSWHLSLAPGGAAA